MPEKTLKVDEAVHKRLEEMKISYGVETFNEVLRHELNIVSGPHMDELAAFLHDDLKKTVEKVVDTIRETGAFEEGVTEARGREILEFVSPDSKTLIASVQFDESSFQVKYRSQSGEMKGCGRGWYSSTTEEPRYGRIRDTSDYTEPEDVIEQVETKITGSAQRWGGVKS